MKNLRKILLGAIVLASIQMPAQTQMPPIPVDTAVRIGTLGNGLKYYIRYNNWPEHRADFYIAQKVGSIQEEESQRGLAHFLEHMCFNGTKHFPGNDLIRYCETLGVKFGADLNAYTSIDQTVYNISNVPTTRQSALDSCLLILHDWASALTLDPKEIDQERGVIHEEWRERTSANSRMLERNLPTVYSGSKYGVRFPIGLMSVVDNFKYKELRDYYEKWYHPANQGIIVVGDIDVDHTEAMIKKLFSPIKNPANQAPVIDEQVPDNEQPIIIVDKDKEQANSVVEVLFKHEIWPESRKGNMDYIIANYTKNIALGMLNDRFYEAALNPDCPYIGARAGDGPFIFAKTKNAFSISATPKSMDKTAMALQTALTEARRAAKFGFTQAEYDRAKANVLSSLDKTFANRDKRQSASFAEDYKGNFLSNEPIPAFEDYYQIMKQLIPQIPLQSINDIIPQLLPETDRNMVILNFNNEKEGNVYPTTESLLEAVHEARKAELTPYIDKVKDEPLLPVLPKPGKIVKEKKGKMFGYKELKLSNGVTVVLKKTDFKKDQISLSGTGQGGKSLYGKNDYTNLAVFDNIIGISGLGKFSNMDLPKILAGKIANARLSMGDKYMGIGGSSSQKDLETMLQLIYLYFTDIKKDEQSFTTLLDSWKIGLKNRDLSHETIFNDSLTATVYGHNPRKKPILMDDLKDINYDRILQIAKERTANASAWTFMFTGDFDEAKLRPLICQYLGSLPVKGKVEKGHLTSSFQKGVVDNTFHRKMETPKALAYMFWHTNDIPYSIDNAIKVSMIGQILSMVYLKKIREDASAAYSCGAEGGSTLEGDYHDYTLLATCPMKPEKADIALRIMKEEAENMTRSCDSGMLAKVKEYMLKNYDNALKTNGYWKGVISMYRKYGIDAHTHYRELIKSQTEQGLCDFMKQILKSGNRISVVMLPQE
ncbi:pitrilysin family protein [Prevotella sp. KH2C16]|uniref:M16 family metallopeptidase n=1 Tax=Prevotella sp. KH2C16 TaxID=1855325 RepID=UPI0008E52319|nr:M16 family metallopeptidase [Prevotella sp. KH2C16]SFF87878.1 zinc protease [Prevotella sp. KH2C16]